MKGRRFLSSDAIPHRQDENGNPLCRWCGGAVAPPRKSWCSQECVDEYLTRSSASAMRSAIFRRDKGVCAACGCDTEKIQRVLSYAATAYSDLVLPIEERAWGWWQADVFRIFSRLGFNRNQTLWEADHILEVSNGGESALDNMQTLCVPCHKQKTRKMHADRAQARRGQKPLPEPAQQIALLKVIQFEGTA